MIEVKLTGEGWEEIEALLNRNTAASILDEGPQDFQVAVAAFGSLCESEGYDFEVWKKGERPEQEDKRPKVADAKREEARAKLKDDLTSSLKAVETVSETAPAPAKGKAKKNGSAEDPEAFKAKTILRLHELFDKNKVAIMKILAEHGGGAKNFNAVAAENFSAIGQALAKLEATL